MSENVVQPTQPAPEPEESTEHVPTPALHQQVRTLAKVKTKITQVAREVGLTVPEFKRHYEADWELGREEAQTGLLGKLLAQGMAGNTNAAFKYLTLMGLVPAQRHEHTGKDGGPVQHVDLTRLNAKQLALYGRLAAIAEGVDPDSIFFEVVDEPRP